MAGKNGWKPKAMCAIGGIVIGSAMFWHWYTCIRPALYAAWPSLWYLSIAVLALRAACTSVKAARAYIGRRRGGQKRKNGG